MTWQAVAHKDFQDAIRSRWLWGLSLLFVGLIGAVPALLFGWLLRPGPDASAEAAQQASQISADVLFSASTSVPLLGLSLSYPGILAFVVAFIALVSSHGSVIDERDSGTLKLLLSLPHSRLDVVVGKFVGRTAVVALPVLAGFLIAVVSLFATSTNFTFGAFVPQVLLMVLVTGAFVSLGVGVSASARSNRQATLGIFGLYFVLAFLWSLFARGFPALVNEVLKRAPGVDQLGGAAVVEMRMFIKYLNPLRAYETLVASLYADSVVSARLIKAGFQEQIVLSQALEGGVPWYFSDGFILLVLVAWVVAPAALGYLAFRDVDL